LPLSPIFGEKIGVFLKNQCCELAVLWAKNAIFCAKKISKNIF
jgi:hypothetical protein